MLQNYIHLLTFQFNHMYFNDKLFKSVEITFDAETTQLLKNLDLILKPFPGGFNLLTSNPELLKTTIDAYPIRFYINSKDPEYINYTQLPNYKISENLLYFNNLTINPSTNNKSLRLHSGEFVGDTDIVAVCQGHISIPGYDKTKTYRFSDALGDAIADQSVIQAKPDSEVFNISNLPQGLIRYSDGSAELGRTYYNPAAIWKKPLGILEIFTNSLLSQFVKNGTVEYAVNFNNRKTIWKYFLINPIYQKFNNLSIINKVKEQAFNGPLKQQVHLNTDALVFESKDEIALAEFSDDNFQLVENFDVGTHSGKIILKNLVKASSAQLFVDESPSGKKTYSHIYI
ncbi:hypothetical protein AQPE_4910 [Aquipluma nitroreducens]|uniref:Uncharacterized protein n=1 Tax=Aquipluma nitroreducens TaxID=2010828 RepID=A0A5K7SGU1_9BACT|nr:hypothetical protein AQPE_4910 [Aquipluma nitroreducens]